MRVSAIAVAIVCSLLLLPGSVSAQSVSGADASVPRLMQFNGTFRPANGEPPAPVEIVTFAIYGDETGGTTLWQETQNVPIASGGEYTVVLGSTNPDGLPMDVFASGQAHWLGVHVERAGESEQARIRIMSVPYALRSADADTLGGKPASAYVLAEPATSTSTTASGKPASTKSDRSPTTPGATTQSAMTGWIPVATDSVGGLGNSVMFQSASNFIGVGTTTPNDAVHSVVNDNAGNFTGYAVQNLNAGALAYSGMLFYDHTGALTQFQGYNNVTHEYRINNIARVSPGGAFNGSINFMIGSSSKFLVASNGNIGIGSTPPTSKLDVAGDINLSGTLRVRGNTMFQVNEGGVGTPPGNVIGLGYGALAANTTGFSNVGIGDSALGSNADGRSNTGIGSGVMPSNNGNYNTATGAGAMSSSTSAAENTAIGTTALASNTTGGDNTAVGMSAGRNGTTGSFNIYLGANVWGVAGESNTMYLGRVGQQTKTVIAGVRSVTTGTADAVTVVIDSNGQLGTINSSRRYKEDIQDMGDASSRLMLLRPVTYRYKQAYTDGSKPMDYGLIAEEVEVVYPDLVAHSKDGKVETVQYQKINAMLLNEMQKQHRTLEEQRTEIELLKARLAALEAQRP